MIDAADIGYFGTLPATDVQAALDELAARAPIPGPPGEKGDAGEQGEDGEPGEKGGAGEQGEDGEPGEKGDEGEQGQRGDTGPPGEPGKPGAPGAKGDAGEQGDPGPRGFAGDRGVKGPQGDTGPGLPPGGDAGQLPFKRSPDDFDVEWRDPVRGQAGWISGGITGLQGPAGAAGEAGAALVTFGVGTPSGTADDGTIYFDTTDPDAYAGYVFNGGGWHPFAGGTPVSTAGTPIGLLLALTRAA